MNKIHWHFKFVGYNEKGEGNTIMFPVEATIINQETEAEALWELKQKIDRKNYYCKEAWECDRCYLQEEQLAQNKRQVEAVENMTKVMHENWFIRLFKKHE